MDPSDTDAAAGSSRTPVGRTVCPSGIPALPDDGGELALGERHDESANANALALTTAPNPIRLRLPTALNAKVCCKFSPA